MWCRKCNMETNGQVCPICGAETVEDLPTEIYWCRDCQIPVIHTLLLAALFYACCLCFFGFLPQGNALYEVLFPVFRFLMFFNFFLLLFTAVPMRYRIVCRGFESDGLQIVHTLKRKKP